jgi:hypothetical protein
MKSDYQLFGPDSAEEDKYLNQHFIETGTYRLVKNKQRLIVVGRKGSGKSAIFKSLNNGYDELYVKLGPNKYSLDFFQDFIKNYGNSNLSSVTAFTAAWKYVFLDEISKQIRNNTLSSNTNVVQDSLGLLKSWARDNIKLDNIQEFAIKDINDLDLKIIPGINGDIDIESIRNVKKNKKIHVLIDDLDNVWQNSKYSTDYLYGLISASRDLAREDNMFVTIFIREDMFTTIQRNFHQIDNIRQSIENIDWNPKLLKHMIAKRIQNYFELKPSFEGDYWNFLFPINVKNYNSFSYMVERTQLRPRELLQFCSTSWNTAETFKKVKVGENDILQAEVTYSRWKLNDLCSEYGSRYKNLELLFNLFAKSQIFYPKSEVNDLIEQAIKNNYIKRFFKDDDMPLTEPEILYFLYECGFIRARVIENGKRKFKCSNTAPNLNLNVIDNFDIHPAYRNSLIG